MRGFVAIAIACSAGCDGLLGLHEATLADGPPDAPPPILVQWATNQVASDTSLALTLARAPVANDVLVMIGAADRDALAGITGGGIASWTLAASSTISENVEVWFGITDGTDAPIQIACGMTGPMWMWVGEWSGLATTSMIDGATAGFGTGAGTAGVQIATTQAPDLVLFAVAAAGAIDTMPPPSPWTALQGLAFGSGTQSEWFQVTTAPGVQAPTATAHGKWDAAIVAFRIGS